MPRYGYGVPFCSLVFFCFVSNLAWGVNQNATSSGSSPELDKAIWTWADKAGSDNAVFISRNAGGTWSEPETVSVKGGINVVPTVTSTGGDDLFAVWSNYSGSQAQLRYRQFKSGVWSEENEYYTGLSSNTAASVAADNSGQLWMVWSGFNGVSDEIYFSTWNGTSFTTAKALTTNDVPDILPVLGINEITGKPWVQWLKFSETGYKQYQSSWNGSEWTEPIAVETETSATATKGQVIAGSSSLIVKRFAAPAADQSGIKPQKKSQSDTENLEIEIPSFITVPESASIHIPGHTVRSLPVRSMSPAK